MTLTTRKVLKYALLPEILPRLRDIYGSGFSHLSLFMACAFGAARLLPRGHPYLDPANTSRFGIRHVFAEARHHLVMKRENIDQIIIYYTLMIGMALLFMQGVLLLLSLTVKGAFAAANAGVGSYVGRFLATPNPDQDLVFMFLDRVFCVGGGGTGIPIFNSRIVSSGECPTAFHEGLYALLSFYNMGLLAVGLIVFLYLVVTVVAETAQSGKPFGQRFNHAWVPVRLILAIALLIPTAQGMNCAQLMTMYIAKWGSGLATNGWILFNEELRNGNYTLIGAPENLVVRPKTPEVTGLLEFMMVQHTCVVAQKWIHDRDVLPYQVNGQQHWPLPSSYEAANTNAGDKAIIIRFGEHAAEYADYTGSVRPLCGELRLDPSDNSSAGAYRLRQELYELLRTMINDDLYKNDGLEIAKKVLPNIPKDPFAVVPTSTMIDEDYLEFYNNQLAAGISQARDVQINDTAWFDMAADRGWGMAATWYNKLADLNGGLISGAYQMPTPIYPEVMVYVKEEKEKNDKGVAAKDSYNPTLSTGNTIEFEQPGDAYVAIALYYAQQLWIDKYPSQPKGSFFKDIIIKLFGLGGLLDMHNNANVHPMAQIVGIGRTLIDSVITNIALGGMAGIGSFLTGLSDNNLMKALSGMSAGISSVLMQIAIMGLGLGFILFYIVPFLPFIYFFLAVGTWVKELFEAMVGVPLWALAHIRIDGEGIPGKAGMNGYYLLFEIFIRPILIVVGLVGAVTIFSAQVVVLHEIWHVVLGNLSSHNPTSFENVTMDEVGFIGYVREAADEFFYLIIYAIVVYMTALASFKLIDLIPNNILRWMGSSVTALAERKGDPAQELLNSTLVGSQMAMGQMQKAMQGLFGRHQ